MVSVWKNAVVPEETVSSNVQIGEGGHGCRCEREHESIAFYKGRRAWVYKWLQACDGRGALLCIGVVLLFYGGTAILAQQKAVMNLRPQIRSMIRWRRPGSRLMVRFKKVCSVFLWRFNTTT